LTIRRSKIAIRICPPHHWDENGAVEGIVLARCLNCDARQWHATDGSWESIDEANKRNKRDHFEQIPSKKRRIMDSSLNSKTAISATSGDPPGNNTPPPPKKTDSRIERMRENRGNTDKYDKLAPQVIKDAESMSWPAALRNAGIPVGSATRLRRHWEKIGLLPSGSPKIPAKTSVDPPNTPAKTPGQLRYEEHQAWVNLKTPWKGLNAKERQKWEVKSSYLSIDKKPSADKTPEPVETLGEKPDDILMDVIKVIVTGKSEEEIVKMGWAARIKLAKLSQHLRVKLALVQSLVDYCNLDNDDEYIQKWFEARSRELATK